MIKRDYEISYREIIQFMHGNEDFDRVFERNTLGIYHHKDSSIHLFQRGEDDSPMEIRVYGPTSQREKEVIQ